MLRSGIGRYPTASVSDLTSDAFLMLQSFLRPSERNSVGAAAEPECAGNKARVFAKKRDLLAGAIQGYCQINEAGYA